MYVRVGQKQMKDEGLEIAYRPYEYLLTPFEKQSCHASIPRLIMNTAVAGLWGVYFLRRNNELHRIFRLSISAELVIALTWRTALAGYVSDRIASRIFVDHNRIRRHKMANQEIRKIMRTFPDAKPYLKPHEKPNSYFWV